MTLGLSESERSFVFFSTSSTVFVSSLLYLSAILGALPPKTVTESSMDFFISSKVANRQFTTGMPTSAALSRRVSLESKMTCGFKAASSSKLKSVPACREVAASVGSACHAFPFVLE